MRQKAYLKTVIYEILGYATKTSTKIIVCVSVVSVILVSVLYYAILGRTTQPLQQKTPHAPVTVTLKTRIEYDTGTDNDLFNPTTNPSGRFYDVVLTCDINMSNMEFQLLRDPKFSCYLEVNGAIVEIVNRSGFEQSPGFFSYKSLNSNLFTFLTYAGNITVPTPIKGYINLTYVPP